MLTFDIMALIYIFIVLFYFRENVHQVGSILFQTNFIITQLAMSYLLLRFDDYRRPLFRDWLFYLFIVMAITINLLYIYYILTCG